MRLTWNGDWRVEQTDTMHSEAEFPNINLVPREQKFHLALMELW